MIGTVTAFKNDKFFDATVILKTEESGNYIDIDVITVPNNVEEAGMGGGMHWELTIDRRVFDESEGEVTNEEIFEEIKKEKYSCYGCSLTIDVIEEEK